MPCAGYPGWQVNLLESGRLLEGIGRGMAALMNELRCYLRKRNRKMQRHCAV
jgi:hypothetical protein